MKVVILAGRMGTRLTEETLTKPKPKVEIGGQTILWHIKRRLHGTLTLSFSRWRQNDSSDPKN